MGAIKRAPSPLYSTFVYSRYWVLRLPMVQGKIVTVNDCLKLAHLLRRMQLAKLGWGLSKNIHNLKVIIAVDIFANWVHWIRCLSTTTQPLIMMIYHIGRTFKVHKTLFWPPCTLAGLWYNISWFVFRALYPVRSPFPPALSRKTWNVRSCGARSINPKMDLPLQPSWQIKGLHW